MQDKKHQSKSPYAGIDKPQHDRPQQQPGSRPQQQPQQQPNKNPSQQPKKQGSNW